MESSCLPYAGLTAYSALTLTAGMTSSSSRKGKRVLVLGAAGGVGHIALQILKAWGAHVSQTSNFFTSYGDILLFSR